TPVVIMLKDGSRPSAADGNMPGFEDTNGNIANATADTLNRNLLVVTDGPAHTFTTPLGFQITHPQYQTWTYQDSNGASQLWTLNSNYTAIDKALFCGTLAHCRENPIRVLIVPQSLVLPSGRSYTFKWNENSREELQEIDLPTGGYISYTYGWGCTANPYTDLTIDDCREAVRSRTVGQGGQTATWNYGAAVTDPNGNDEVHTFSYVGTSYGTYETQVTYWKGLSVPGAGGTLLKTVATTYTGENGLDGHTYNVRPTSPNNS
ncbi:MAG TPA: hypothetical protein VI756_18185, partial [Blastocatellia bacterium]